MYKPWKIVVNELTLTVSLMFLEKSCLQEREKQIALYFHVLWDVLIFGAVETIAAVCKYFLVYFLCQYHHLR